MQLSNRSPLCSGEDEPAGHWVGGRRDLLRWLASTLLLLTTNALSQGKPSIVIGYLAVASKDAGAGFFAAFKEGLAAYGWKEGTNYTLVSRWANSDYTRLDDLAKEIAATAPAIVVAAPSLAVIAAAKALPNVPVVQANGGDPVELGLAASLARPGGMVTGVTNIIGETSEKSLELLLTAAPRVRCVGFLYEESRVSQLSVESARRSLAKYAVEGRFAGAATAAEIEPAVAQLAAQGAQALVVLSGGILPSQRQPIVDLASRRRWPIVSGLREFTEAGGLMSYGANRNALYNRAAYYVDKILKGAQPRSLPFERPTRFELVINLKTAKTLGLTIPQSLLLRADEVIQ